MKIKTCIAMLCAAVLVCTAVGCGDKNSGEESSETITISAEAKEKLQAAVDIQPAEVPEGGWTDETLIDVMYINGEKTHFPCSLDDYGEGIEPIRDNAQYFQLNNDGSVDAGLNFYDDFVGVCRVLDCESINEVRTSQLECLSFSYDENAPETYPDIYPISINGVTMGTNYDEVVEKLGLTPISDDLDPYKNDNGTFAFSLNTESFNLLINGTNFKVNYILISLEEE